MFIPSDWPARAAGDPRNTPVHLRKELLAMGFDDRAIRSKVRSGEWVRVRHGAYANAAAWQGLGRGGRHELIARSVVKRAGTPVVLSHVSAAMVMGAPDWGLDLNDVHLTRRDGRVGRREAGVAQHRGHLSEAETWNVHGLDVTTPTRACLEVIASAGPEEALCVVNHFLHGGHTSLALLHDGAAQMDRWPGTLHSRVVLSLADPHVESVGESRTLHLLHDAGLPSPVPQVEVYDEQGRLLGRVDFAWPDLGVFLEFDGREKYERFRRAGESVTDMVLREKRRESDICRVTGWRCIRISWADLERPAATAALLRAVLTGRAA